MCLDKTLHGNSLIQITDGSIVTSDDSEVRHVQIQADVHTDTSNTHSLCLISEMFIQFDRFMHVLVPS